VNLDEIQSPLPARRMENIEKVEIKPEEQKVEDNTEEVVVEKESNVVPINGQHIKRKDKKSIFLLLLLLIIFVIGGFFLFSKISKKTELPATAETTIIYWGLWEDENVMQTIISEFENKNPDIKVNYKRNQITDYRTRLKSRLSRTDTEDIPDIFRIHTSWIPMFKPELASVPQDTVNNLNLDDDLYNCYKRDLKINGVYKAIPIAYDGLALFYNKDLVEGAGAKLPETWVELENAAEKIKKVDENKKIKIAGVAMGLVDNVDHFSDIIGLMMQQSGVNPMSLSSEKNLENLKSILTYYSNFRTKYHLWDESLPSSTDYFAAGKLGFYFAPSWRVFDIENLNPNLNYGIMTVPQLPVSEKGEDLTNIHWGSYWVEGVNVKSEKQKEIWKFMEFLASKETADSLFTIGSQIRNFGQISPRKSDQEKMMANTKVKPFVMSADNAYNWYLSSNTFDNGLNDEMIKYFGDAINSLSLLNKGMDEIIETLTSGLNQLTVKYQIK
jgi:multiple sugar transport system substrate-binding protein